MRATTSHQPPRDTASNLRSSRILAVLLSLPMCALSACVADTPDTATATQALGPNCHILRPYAWDSKVRACWESTDNGGSIDLLPGHSFEFFAAGGIAGSGQVTAVCRTELSGLWDEVDKVCLPDN